MTRCAAQHKGALGALDKRLDVLLGRLEQVSLPSALVPRHLPSADVAQHSSSDSGSVGSADSSDSTDSSQDLDHGSDRTDTEAEPGEEALQDLVADMDAFDAAHQGLALEGADEDGDDLIDYSKPVPQAGGSGQPIMYEDFFGPRPAGGRAASAAAAGDFGSGSEGDDSDGNAGIAALGGADSEEEDAIVNHLHEEGRGGDEEGEASDSGSELDVDDGGAVGTRAGLHFPVRSERPAETPEVLSTFQKRQAALAREVAELEEAAVASKTWELQGEVGGKTRPVNSLLHATLDTEARRKLAPVVTPASTNALEELIKQRIRDEAWDDVERRVLDSEAAALQAKKDLPDVSTSGDRAGLGEVYAKEYEKRVMGVAEESEESKVEVEVAGLWAALSRNLDALTNFHFTPMPAVPEAGIAVKPGVAAVAMEEALPGAVAADAAQAPEEVHAPARGHGNAAAELTSAQRKAHRRAAKVAGRKRRREAAAQDALRAAADPKRAKASADARMREDLARNKAVSLAAGRGPAAAAAAGAAGRGQLADVATSGHIKSGALFSALQAEAQSKIARAAGTAGRGAGAAPAGSADGAELRRSKKKRGKGGRGAGSKAAGLRL